MIKEERKKKKRRGRFLKTLLVIILLLAVLALVTIRLFTVKKVQVEGNVLYDDQVIEDAVLNDKYSWNGLYVYLKYKFTDTKAIPFVDTVDVKLNITSPHTLTIKVYEKGIMGYMYIPGIDENAYFDKDGIVVETSSDVIEGVPRIDGIECNEVVLYEKLPIDQSQLKEILMLTQGLKREEMIPDTITYGVNDAPMISYGTVDVLMGNLTNITQKLDRLKAIYPSIEDKSGILHLENWTEEVTNIVFDVTE